MNRLRPCLALSLVSTLALLLPSGLDGALPSPPAGSVTALSGQVTVRRADGQSWLLRRGDLVFWGDVVETPQDGTARITFNGGTTLSVRGLSRLHVRGERGPTGGRYAVELLRAKVADAVDRVLMRPGDGDAGRGRNAVASVRG